MTTSVRHLTQGNDGDASLSELAARRNGYARVGFYPKRPGLKEQLVEPGVEAPREAARCPFLVAAMANRPWLYSESASCRRPDGRVRVPPAVTLTCICMTPAYLVCPGYLARRGASRKTQVMNGRLQ